MEKSFRLEVQTEVHGKWTFNALRFGSKEEANSYGRDLWARWSSVREWRVTECDDAITHTWTPEGLKEISPT